MAEEKDETINKLITALAQQSSLLGLGSEKHGEEAIELKKEWFKTVASSLEKTNQAIDRAHIALGDLQKSFHVHQLDIKTELSKLKDFINEELKDLKTYHDDDFEKLSERLEAKIIKINDKLEQIPIAAANLKDELKKNTDSFRDKMMSDEVKPLSDKVTNIYVKVMVLSTVAGIVASALLSIILAYTKG